jgi:NAD(P)-dependent dehydrogenase (short-subunit alcohol dehydrogenase family)
MSDIAVPALDLTGRIALVTGASSGFGEHWARLLAAAGARVVLAARRVDKLEAVRQAIVDAGGQAHAVALDVSDEAAMGAAYDEAERVFGTVDTIIANAGITESTSANRLTGAEFAAVIATNLSGVFLTLREGGRRLQAAGSAESGRGRVVIVGSVTTRKLHAAAAAYAASKAGVTHLGRVLAREWATRGINVNIIHPGYFRTEMTDAVWDHAIGKSLLKSFPRGKLGEITDMDVPLLFLCSDLSAGVTGSEFVIDDGQTL